MKFIFIDRKKNNNEIKYKKKKKVYEVVEIGVDLVINQGVLRYF